MDVRYGRKSDFEWLRKNDDQVSSEWIGRCLDHAEYVLSLEGPQRIGFLRFSLFWGIVPYMDLIWVMENHRRQGVGTALFDFWEQGMKKRGARVLMTSAMSDELEPQTWHKRNGFRECGQLTFGRYQPRPEVFFTKDVPEFEKTQMVTERS